MGPNNSKIEAAVPLAVFALAAAFIRPSGNFPLLDDAFFALPAFDFARTGHFHLTFAPPSMRAQVVWGAMFVRLFGPTFDALRIASMVSSAIAIILFHAILRRAGAGRNVRLVATTAFALYPLFFRASFTFMTEGPFVCASVVAMYFYVRAFRENRLVFFLLGGAMAAVSWWVRQTGIMTTVAPLAVVLYLRPPKWKQAAGICLLPMIAFTAIYFTRLDWLAASPEEFNRSTHMWHESSFRLPQQVALIYHYFFFTLHNTALFLAPLVVLAFSAVRRKQIAIFAAVAIFAAIGTGELIAEHFPMPYYPGPACCDTLLGSVFTNFGLGPPTLIDGFNPQYGYPFEISYGARVLLTIAVSLLAVVLAFALIARARRDPVFLLCVGYAVAHTAALCASGAFFDRYVLMAAWPLAIALAMVSEWSVRKGAAAIAVLVLFFLFDTLAVDEYFAWNRARWHAWDDLRARGVAITDIHGGNEPIAMFETAYMTDIHARRRMVYGGPDKRRYALAFHELPGRRVFARYPFSGWFGHHKGTVYVLESMAR